jgi:hypothetical protein
LHWINQHRPYGPVAFTSASRSTCPPTEELVAAITNAGVTRNAARTLVGLRQTLLLETARALVLYDRDPLLAAVDRAKSLLSADALTFVRDADSLIATILKSTGLVTDHAGTLQRAHRDLAEFMVGQAYANDLDKALRVEGTHRQRPWPPNDRDGAGLPSGRATPRRCVPAAGLDDRGPPSDRQG